MQLPGGGPIGSSIGSGRNSGLRKEEEVAGTVGGGVGVGGTNAPRGPGPEVQLGGGEGGGLGDPALATQLDARFHVQCLFMLSHPPPVQGKRQQKGKGGEEEEEEEEEERAASFFGFGALKSRSFVQGSAGRQAP